MDHAHDATVTRLWAELSGTLRTWFRSHTGDEHAAEDLLQESFLRVHDRLGSVREEERLAAWLRGIARNLLIDWRRARRPREEGAEGELEEDEVSASSSEEGNVDPVVASWLEPTIEELDEIDRETLRLTELEGLSQKEAAERLGISLSALKSRVLRGRERLRERVLACCELEFDRRGGIVAYRERSSNCCNASSSQIHSSNSS